MQLRREWFELLCKRLFHPSAGLFVSVEENSEAVFPNPNPSSVSNAYVYSTVCTCTNNIVHS